MGEDGALSAMQLQFPKIISPRRRARVNSAMMDTAISGAPACADVQADGAVDAADLLLGEACILQPLGARGLRPPGAQRADVEDVGLQRGVQRPDRRSSGSCTSREHGRARVEADPRDRLVRPLDVVRCRAPCAGGERAGRSPSIIAKLLRDGDDALRRAPRR